MGNPEFNPDIMDKLSVGDHDAFRSFFSAYYSPLCYFGFQLIRDRPAAEDIVKDTFIKVWLKQQDFGTPQNVKAFLYITVRNACLNYLRHMQVREATQKELSYLGMDREDAHVLNSMIKTEVMHEIYAEIEKFPKKRRHIFKLAYLEGMKNEEIANMLNISISTVKTQKARAILALRVHFTDHQLVMASIFFSQIAATATATVLAAHACM